MLLYSGLAGAILAYRYHMAETPHAEVTKPGEGEAEKPPTREMRRKAA